MRAYSLGNYPYSAYSQAPPPGELVAATPLGKDENGKNLVAYIMRTEEEVSLPLSARKQNANSNSPFAEKTVANPRTQTAPQAQPLPQQQAQQQTPVQAQNAARAYSAARFIKPDELLTSLEQEQLAQLRARDADVNEDAQRLNDGGGDTLLTSFVYDQGPDGRRYAVGVAAPLLAQKAGLKNSETLQLPQGELNPYLQASLAYRHSATQDISGPRAGLFNQAI